MKRHPSPTRRSLIVLPFGRTRLEWFLLAFLLFAPQLVLGDTHWTGNTDTTWGTSTNWDNGVPSGNTVNAVFNTTFTLGHQPTLTANPSTFGGIWMTTGVGQDVTIGGSTFTLTLNGNTINGTAGLGILIDNATTLISSVIKAKPSVAKGKYIKACYLSSSMGPGIAIDTAQVEAAAKA